MFDFPREIGTDIHHIGRGGGVHAATQGGHGRGEYSGNQEARHSCRKAAVDVPWENGIRVVHSYAQRCRMALVKHEEHSPDREENQRSRNSDDGIGQYAPFGGIFGTR